MRACEAEDAAADAAADCGADDCGAAAKAEGARLRRVHQVLGWGFLALRGDMHFHLLQREDSGSLEITTRLERGTMMRAFGSRVAVAPAPVAVATAAAAAAGKQQQQQQQQQRSDAAGASDLDASAAAPLYFEVEMEMFMAPAIPVPPLVRHLVGAQVRRQLKGVLEALAVALEARAAGLPLPLEAARAKAAPSEASASDAGAASPLAATPPCSDAGASADADADADVDGGSAGSEEIDDGAVLVGAMDPAALAAGRRSLQLLRAAHGAEAAAKARRRLSAEAALPAAL